MRSDSVRSSLILDLAEHMRMAADELLAAVLGDGGAVLRNWDAIKATEAGREPGIFGEVPENLPALLYARKVQRRAATAGLLERAPDPDPEQEQDPIAERGAAFEQIGEQLFATVDEARRLRVDPELALRAAAQRFRTRLDPDDL